MWTYNYTRPNELYHHGIKGMKWGIRHDPERERRRQAKREYKSLEKELRRQSDQLDEARSKTDKDIDSKYRAARKNNKKLYKQKQISKAEYKKNKKSISKQRYQYYEQNEMKWINGAYAVERARSANRLVYVKDIKGENSKAYQKGLAAFKKGEETLAYSNSVYYVSKKNGKYQITRNDIYYY